MVSQPIKLVENLILLRLLTRIIFKGAQFSLNKNRMYIFFFTDVRERLQLHKIF